MVGETLHRDVSTLLSVRMQRMCGARERERQAGSGQDICCSITLVLLLCLPQNSLKVDNALERENRERERERAEERRRRRKAREASAAAEIFLLTRERAKLPTSSFAMIPFCTKLHAIQSETQRTS